MPPAPRPSSRGVLLDLIRSSGPVTRVDLAEITGLTQATVSVAVRELIGDGLVVETGRGDPTGGKPRTWLEVNPQSRLGVGVHISRESISYVVANLAGEMVGRQRVHGAGDEDPELTVARIARDVDHLLDDLAVDRRSVVGIGLALPGPIDRRAGTIGRAPSLPHWADFPIRRAMTAATGIACELENDATAAALGEYWLGATTDHTTYAAVYMDVGIGAGIVVDGTIYRGISSNVGEIGHITVDPTAGRCPCGNIGCLELVAAPPVVAARAEPAPDGSRRSFGELARDAVHGDDAARLLIEASAEHLATGVVTLVNLFDVDLVVLAGSAFVDAATIYVRTVSSALDERAFVRGTRSTTVRPSLNGHDAAVIGAATTVLQEKLSPRSLRMVSLGVATA
ncbi:ROK family transcriptional regulator [Curtobacterium sp. ISL-83]|uniref:ROK family transcriptional regulator n=1 Tax=Curtobacterium sp. ISL-83 TaxID=2819145 RepID=UPI001BE6DD89|nr:ROK family transcriptional regulator [Curtobacterium sp. ISL-83]MBT2501117.1 ROK family transcriptional regulator [Curtobacterium sp. ISL-83]